MKDFDKDNKELIKRLSQTMSDKEIAENKERIKRLSRTMSDEEIIRLMNSPWRTKSKEEQDEEFKKIEEREKEKREKAKKPLNKLGDIDKSKATARLNAIPSELLVVKYLHETKKIIVEWSACFTKKLNIEDAIDVTF